MKYEANIHPVQIEILRALLFTPDARFSDLNLAGLSNDHFTFHITQLVETGLVQKAANGRYRLSPKGKEYANRMDTDSKAMERQGKLAVLLVSVRKSAAGKDEFLMQQRLKHPYFGFWGYMGGKIRWGETVLEAAARELKEETGLTAKLELRGVMHKIDYTQDKKLLEDKYFYVVKTTAQKGSFIAEFEGGKNQWMGKADILKLEKEAKVFQGVTLILEDIQKPGLHFWEDKYFYTPEEY